MLESLHRNRRRLARATLAGFALFWALTAMTPCVMAAPCMQAGMDMSAHCTHNGDPTPQKHPCHPVAKSDCQNIDQSRLDNPATMDSTSPYTPVLLQTLAATTQAPDLQRTLQHQRNAAAVPQPSLNLKHAILLI